MQRSTARKKRSNDKYSMDFVSIFSWIHPYALLLIGVCSLIAYSLPTALVVRAVQVLVFYVIVSQLKKLKFLFFILLILSVTFFYLLIPEGRVIYQIGLFKVTDAALKLGLYRGLTLTGYVFLSLWCVSPKLQLPTHVGKLLSLMLQYFNLLFSNSIHEEFQSYVKTQRERVKINRKSNLKSKLLGLLIEIIHRTDLLVVMSIEDMSSKRLINSTQAQQNSTGVQKSVGLFLIIIAVLVSWGPVLFLSKAN